MVVGREKPGANKRLEIGGCRGDGRVRPGLAGANRVTRFAGLCKRLLEKALGVELRVNAVCLWCAQECCAGVVVAAREFENCPSWSSDSGPDIAAAKAPRKGATEEQHQGSGALRWTAVVEERPGQGLFV